MKAPLKSSINKSNVIDAFKYSFAIAVLIFCFIIIFIGIANSYNSAEYGNPIVEILLLFGVLSLLACNEGMSLVPNLSTLLRSNLNILPILCSIYFNNYDSITKEFSNSLYSISMEVFMSGFLKLSISKLLSSRRLDTLELQTFIN